MIEKLEDRRLLNAFTENVDVGVWSTSAGWRDSSTGQRVPNAVVWIDSNRNGKRDAKEPKLTIGESSVATFKSLKEGTYRIGLMPLGYPYDVTKAQFQEYTVEKPSDSGGGYICACYTVPGSSDYPSDAEVLFHIRRDVPEHNSFRGYAFFDKDNGGNDRDDVKADTAAVGARVYIDVNGNGKFDANEPFTFTDDKGNYHLTGWSGHHLGRQVRITMDRGWQTTDPVALQRDGTAKFGVNAILPDAKIIATAALSKDLWSKEHSQDINTMKNVFVYLDLNRDGKWQRGEPRQSHQDNYEDQLVFSNLYPGKYRLRVSVPPGYAVDRRFIEVTVKAKETRARMFSFRGTQSLNITYYTDTNHNGRFDPGEADQDVRRDPYGMTWEAVHGRDPDVPLVAELYQLIRRGQPVIQVKGLPPTKLVLNTYLAESFGTPGTPSYDLQYYFGAHEIEAGWEDNWMVYIAVPHYEPYQ